LLVVLQLVATSQVVVVVLALLEVRVTGDVHHMAD
jgi:hypothetical protein